MPTVLLSDVARARFQSISFFLLVLLLCAWVVRAAWNALAADVPRMPRLSYGKAVGLVTLWGLLFVLVLTMISGARELLTPGAWKKQGLTYTLADDPPKAEPARPVGVVARRDKLERLRAALWVYARSHDGEFPPSDLAPEIEPETWQLVDTPGLRYLYVKRRTLGQDQAVLAYEPGLYERSRFVLMADGVVRMVDLDELRRLLGPPTAVEVSR
jgi:hypothetical protein